jgi:fructan beta-fructosidase
MSNDNYLQVRYKQGNAEIDRRPLYHYTPKSNWMSDPNGLIYHEGEFHLFYQYDTYENVFNQMSWGHAVSSDLLHWEELGIAIAPSDDGLGMVFSGCTIVDVNNASGLGKNTLVAFYTSPNPRQQQSMAYSTDKGRTWTKYECNPVIANKMEDGIGNDFRDPKIIWLNDANKWIMSIAAKDHIQFWSSTTLLHWTKESEFGHEFGAHEHSNNGAWECPDLFPISYKSKISNSQEKENFAWVLLVSMNQGGPNGECCTQYFVGEFVKVNEKYQFESYHKETKWLDYGPDNYAGVTFTQMNERKIFLSWMSNWQYALDVPSFPFRGVTCFPRELSLYRIGDEYYIYNKPIHEIDGYFNNRVKDIQLFNQNEWLIVDDISSSRILMEAFTYKQFSVELLIGNTEQEWVSMGYDIDTSIIYLERSNSGETSFKSSFAEKRYEIPVKESMEVFEIDILIDKMTMEIFINQGRYTLSSLIFPTKPYTMCQLNTKATLTKFEIYQHK